MGTPSEYLPPALPTDSIVELIASLDLPARTRMSSLQVTAAYRFIYLVRQNTNVPVLQIIRLWCIGGPCHWA